MGTSVAYLASRAVAQLISRCIFFERQKHIKQDLIWSDITCNNVTEITFKAYFIDIDIKTCTLCSKQFKNQKSLSGHIRQCHGNAKRPQCATASVPLVGKQLSNVI